MVLPVPASEAPPALGADRHRPPRRRLGRPAALPPRRPRRSRRRRRVPAERRAPAVSGTLVGPRAVRRAGQARTLLLRLQGQPRAAVRRAASRSPGRRAARTRAAPRASCAPPGRRRHADAQAQARPLPAEDRRARSWRVAQPRPSTLTFRLRDQASHDTPRARRLARRRRRRRRGPACVGEAAAAAEAPDRAGRVQRRRRLRRAERDRDHVLVAPGDEPPALGRAPGRRDRSRDAPGRRAHDRPDRPRCQRRAEGAHRRPQAAHRVLLRLGVRDERLADRPHAHRAAARVGAAAAARRLLLPALRRGLLQRARGRRGPRLDLYMFLGDYIYEARPRARTPCATTTSTRSTSRPTARSTRSIAATRTCASCTGCTRSRTSGTTTRWRTTTPTTTRRPRWPSAGRATARRSSGCRGCRSRSDRHRVYRQLSYGGLADIFMTDERQYRTGSNDGQPRHILGEAQMTG